MRVFYVRPQRAGGYGRGDGTSYENAWNGFDAIDWRPITAAQGATLWVCGLKRRHGRGELQIEVRRLAPVNSG
jgi:hypothetical protein